MILSSLGAVLVVLAALFPTGQPLNDWNIQRQDLTGAVLFRATRAAVAVKGKEGKCRLITLVSFKQEFFENEFQKLRLDGRGRTPVEIPCENVGR